MVVARGDAGGFFLSEDGGDSWQKRQREFGEIRTLAVMPN